MCALIKAPWSCAPSSWCFQGFLGVAVEGQVLELVTGSRQNRDDAALIHYLFLKGHHLLSQQSSSELQAHLAAPRIRIRYGYQLNSRGRKQFSAHQCHLFIILLQGSTECNQSDPFAQLQEQHGAWFVLVESACRAQRNIEFSGFWGSYKSEIAS